MRQPSAYPNLGFGLGLRQLHLEEVLADRPQSVDWFEILTENFLDGHEGYRDCLHDLRRDYPLVLHGVGMSIGGTDPLNELYLKKLRILAEEINAPFVSDHLCWTGVNGYHTHDLLPVPYTAEALNHIAQRVRQVQDALQLQLVLENPSSYLQFAVSEMPEWEFLAQLAHRTECGILLDVNNVYVSAFNHGFDPRDYLNAIPPQHVAQIHLAGFTHCGNHIIDTHDAPVDDHVWDLYAYAVRRFGAVSTMIEWDEKIPPFVELVAELDKARSIANAPVPVRVRRMESA